MSGDEILHDPIDFNTLLICNPTATFAVRVAGESMIGCGIHPRDIAIVDRSREVVNGSVVVAMVGDSFTLKTYRQRNERIILEAANPAFSDIDVTGDESFEIWGVLQHVIRDHRL
jgi:DNA polymerase V